uniref:hypothetical protein n=1 Tax=uncultured Psychrobacter sp. TaxID=259303 RepID=UPI0025994E06|nr:hypothetical protein [uncultured Psychrobacter sp.]
MAFKKSKDSSITLTKQYARKPYPWLRIFVSFALLGGWIGANAMNFILFLLDGALPRNMQGFDFQYFITNMFEGLGFKMIAGLFPALITAGVIIYFKLHLKTIKSWLALGILGFMATVPFSLIVMLIADSVDLGLFYLATLVGMSGLCSAIIIGGLTIPKS